MLVSCSDDIDIIGPYEETAVVYSLLNANDSTQSIRINKAFLGEGDALLMAANPDSNYFDTLQVSLIRVKNNVALDTIPFLKTLAQPKDSGLFASQPNYLYKNPVPFAIDKEATYTMHIFNPKTAKTFSSSTNIVKEIKVQAPSQNPSIKIPLRENSPYNVRFETAINGKEYNLTIRFSYEEQDIPSGSFTNHSIDWVFNNFTVIDDQVSELRTVLVDANAFYKFVASKVAANQNKTREVGKLDFIFTAAHPTLYTFLQVNQPSLTITNHIPVFSNIDNGVGMFSSRLIHTVFQKELDPVALDSLRFGRFTKDLNFL